MAQGKFIFTFPSDLILPKQLEYKYVRGGWENKELDEFGNSTLNRVLENPQGHIYDFVPRVQYGGSQAGTVDVNSAAAVTPDNDRLFANADECYYSTAFLGAARVKTAAALNVDALSQRRDRSSHRR